MQLHRRKSSILLVGFIPCLALSFMCLSCNDKPKFKKKHYTDKRVVRSYKRNDALLATATNKVTVGEKVNSLPHKPINVCKPKPADKLNHSNKRKKIPIAVIPADPTVTIVTEKQNRYYIIASSHSSEDKAVEMSKEYVDLGFPVEIITSDNKYRVTIRSEKSRKKAIKLRDSLRIKLKREDFWLLRY